jgi:lipopolysaccharide transport system permease protein
LAFIGGSAIAATSMSYTLHDPVARARPLELHGDMSVAGRHRQALSDVREGLRLWPLAWALGWLDIRLRYRGSILGPFWLTLSTAIMVGALGFLYSALFHTDIHDYLPFLALSQVLWSFLSTLVGDACTCFTLAENMIRATRMPMSVHALRTVVRNVLVLAHNVVVIVVVDIIFSVWPGWHGVMAVPGLLVWLVDALAICLLLGSFCARFRDIGPIVNSIMQIAFFLTPVLWQPAQLGRHAALLPFNPFFVLLEIVRAPLLGQTLSKTVWVAAISYSALLCVMAWGLFMRARGRLAFWV